MIKTILLLGLASLSLTACGPLVEALIETALVADAPPPAAFDAALYDRGVEVYLAAYCGSCHALEAAGSWGAFGPTHDGMGLTAAERLADPNYSGHATTPEEYLRESILEPQLYYVPTYVTSPHRMPAYTHLPAEDIDAMVYMLLMQQ